MSGHGISPFAWAFMLVSMTAVTVLVAWTFYRILKAGSDSGGGAGSAPGAGGGESG